MTVERLNETNAGRSGVLPRPQALVALGIVAGLSMIAWQCGRYILLGAYLDHIEGNVLISGWQYVHGAPLYASLDGAPLFATYYGPLAYLLEVPALALFGAGVTASKITSLLALSSTLAVIAWHLRRAPAGGQALNGLLFLNRGTAVLQPYELLGAAGPHRGSAGGAGGGVGKEPLRHHQRRHLHRTRRERVHP